MARSQLSILASPELVMRVKERAAEKSLTVTAYVLKLVGADLDGAQMGRSDELLERLSSLELRVAELESRGQ
ncbi:MAG: hypothetical protein EBU30_01715 [Synechococcaceae bacterium WB6_3B_236]|nr:hypothetical protein [Synechococcaceae bacterium WB6_3B_236]